MIAFYTAILMPPAGAAGAVGAVGAVGAWTLAPGPNPSHLSPHPMPQIPESPFHSAFFTRSSCPFFRPIFRRARLRHRCGESPNTVPKNELPKKNPAGSVHT